MDRVLLDILLPATGKHYDFWVPKDMQVCNVAKLVANVLEIVEPEFYRATTDAALMFCDTGEIQNPNIAIGEIGFVMGDCLVLM